MWRVTLISIEDLDQKKYKEDLNKGPIFKFLKAARNITAHRFILASYSKERPFQVDYIRSQFEPSGGGFASARLNISIEKFRTIFAEVLAERPWERDTYNAAGDYLTDLEKRPEILGKLDIEKVAQEGLDTVAKLLSPT